MMPKSILRQVIEDHPQPIMRQLAESELNELEELIQRMAHRLCRYKYKPGEENFVAAILRQELQEAQGKHLPQEPPRRMERGCCGN
jgi:hypothetical protein